MEDIAYLQCRLVGEILISTTYLWLKICISAHIACHIFAFPRSVVSIGRRSILHTYSITAWSKRVAISIIFPCKQSTTDAVNVINRFQICTTIYRESVMSLVCVIVIPSDIAFWLVGFIVFCSIIFKRQR